MGGRTDDTTSNETTTSYKETEQEKQLNQFDVDLRKAVQPQLIDVNQNALALSGLLLQGQDLPGYLQGLPGGISPEVTQNLVNQSLRDIGTNAQFAGILDSGTAGELGVNAAANIRTQSEQFNLQNLLQLLNLATGSSAQAQAPVEAFGQQMSGRLQSLRPQTVYEKGRVTGTSYGLGM